MLNLYWGNSRTVSITGVGYLLLMNCVSCLILCMELHKSARRPFFVFRGVDVFTLPQTNEMSPN